MNKENISHVLQKTVSRRGFLKLATAFGAGFLVGRACQQPTTPVAPESQQAVAPVATPTEEQYEAAQATDAPYQGQATEAPTEMSFQDEAALEEETPEYEATATPVPPEPKEYLPSHFKLVPSYNYQGYYYPIDGVTQDEAESRNFHGVYRLDRTGRTRYFVQVWQGPDSGHFAFAELTDPSAFWYNVYANGKTPGFNSRWGLKGHLGGVDEGIVSKDHPEYQPFK